MTEEELIEQFKADLGGSLQSFVGQPPSEEVLERLKATVEKTIEELKEIGGLPPELEYEVSFDKDKIYIDYKHKPDFCIKVEF